MSKLQGLILAAGNGSRLAALTSGLPKGLLTVGWGTLLGLQVRALRQAGVKRIAMVVGYGSDHIRSAFGDSIEYIENTDYSSTNSLFSLSLAERWVDEQLLLMNCDVLIHPGVIMSLAEMSGCALAYDSSSGHDEEHMKVQVEQGRVCAISKSLDHSLVSGENVGALRFDASGARELFASAKRVLTSAGTKAWAPAAVNDLCQSVPVHTLDIKGQPWCEVDFPEDAHHARARVWPAVRAAYEDAAVLDSIVTTRPRALTSLIPDIRSA